MGFIMIFLEPKLPLIIFKRVVVAVYLPARQPARFVIQVMICRPLEREERFHLFG